MLTRKQQELLSFIQERLAQNGVSPSFDEMKDALQLKSKSGIHRLISGLEERGFIRRLPHRARALEVTRSADSLAVRAAEAAHKAVSGAKHLATQAAQAATQAARSVESAIALPLMGRIAAGTAIEALRDGSRSVDVPAFLIGRGDHYVLEVAGDSMVEAGIHDGDNVIIQQCDNVDNGAIAVALIDGQEVTLKSFYKKGTMIDLVPANGLYQTMSFPADRVKIQGRLVGLLRKY